MWCSMFIDELRSLLQKKNGCQVVCYDWAKDEYFPLSTQPGFSVVDYGEDPAILLDFHSGECRVTAEQMLGVLEVSDLEGSDGNVVLMFDWTKDAVLAPSHLETGLAEFQGKPAVILRCDYIGNHDCMEMPVPTEFPPSKGDDADFFKDFPGEDT